MKITKSEIIFLFLLVSINAAFYFLYRILELVIEPKLAFIIFTCFYGFALMSFSLLYRNGILNISIFNNEEKGGKRYSKLGILVSGLIFLIGFLVYFLPYHLARIACNIIIILAGTMILISLWRERNS